MKFFNGKSYVEVKDHRYKIHPTENTILGFRDEPKSLRTQYQVQNETQAGKNQKVVENNGKIEVKNCPKKNNQLNNNQNLNPNCPSCKQKNWLEFDKGYYCRNCEYIINKQKHQIDKKVRRRNHYFSIWLNYDNKNIREVWMNMVNTTYNSSEDMNNELQELKGERNLKFYKNSCRVYDNRNILSIIIDGWSSFC